MRRRFLEDDGDRGGVGGTWRRRVGRAASRVSARRLAQRETRSKPGPRRRSDY